MVALQACECNEMQGFLFSRPVPLSETWSLMSREIHVPSPHARPEEDLLRRFPWKNPQVPSTAGSDCLPVEVSGNGDVFHGESI